VPHRTFIGDVEHEQTILDPNIDRRARTSSRPFQRFEAALIHDSGAVRLGKRVRVHPDVRLDTRAQRRRAQCRGEPTGLEQRRMDPVRKPRGLLERDVHDSTHLVDERTCVHRIGVEELLRKLEMDRQRDQMLLRTLVELALDAPPLRRPGEDEAPAGRP
jgi:hypothetical protein